MTILLKIFKTVGKAILWVAAAVLAIFLIAIFCPIFYEIGGEKYDKVRAEARIKAFFGILKVDLSYDNGELSPNIRIFGKKLRISEKKDKDSKTDPEKKDNINAEPEQRVKNRDLANKKKTSDSSKNSQGPGFKKNTIPQRNASSPSVASIQSEPDNIKSDGSQMTTIWENEVAEEKERTIKKVKLSDIRKSEGANPPKGDLRIKYVKMQEKDVYDGHTGENDTTKEKKRIDHISTDNGTDEKQSDGAYDKEDIDEGDKLDVAYFVNMPKEERRKLISAVIKLIKSLFKSIKPNDFYLCGKLGLSDPSLTGRIVGAAWSLGGILNKRIEIQAVFDREIIEGETRIKGYIVPAFLLFYLIRFIAVKPVRKIILLLIKGDKHGK